MDPNIYLNAIVFHQLARRGQKQQAVPDPEFKPFDLAYLTCAPAKRDQSQNARKNRERDCRDLRLKSKDADVSTGTRNRPLGQLS
jgi:hypothetical protein